MSSIKNLSQLSSLMEKYPDMIDVRHTYQPLRGFIIDDSFGKFKSEELQKTFKEGELPKDTVIFFEISDKKWIPWLQKVFWSMFRSSLSYDARVKEINSIRSFN